MQKPSVGRIVHLARGGDHLAAIITAIHPDGKLAMLNGFVSLCVFPPGGGTQTTGWIRYSEANEDATWHYPERVE